jgi:hypothetical protein
MELQMEVTRLDSLEGKGGEGKHQDIVTIFDGENVDQMLRIFNVLSRWGETPKRLLH